MVTPSRNNDPVLKDFAPSNGSNGSGAHRDERRRTLPNERKGFTHKFSVAGHEGYITVGLYDDGTPGEVFITMSKPGSTIRGLMDGIGVLTSICLQYGVPPGVICAKLAHAQFEPRGFARGHPAIKEASSILDYVYRYLAIKFLDEAPRRPRNIDGEGDMFGDEDDEAAHT